MSKATTQAERLAGAKAEALHLAGERNAGRFADPTRLVVIFERTDGRNRVIGYAVRTEPSGGVGQITVNGECWVPVDVL